MDMPTMKRKNGAMRSVGVSPFHTVCRKGEKTYSSFPGKFTRIIAAMVKPLIPSRKIRRSGCDVILILIKVLRSPDLYPYKQVRLSHPEIYPSSKEGETCHPLQVQHCLDYP